MSEPGREASPAGEPSPAREAAPAGEASPAYITALNPEQRRAVVHRGSPLLILAGAGSGKTRVITTKIAYLVGSLGMSPRSILAVTFTNKAAQEMKERVLAMVPHAEDVMVRTFHSFGAWFLRVNCELAGLERNFLIYDQDDSLSLLKGVLGEEEDRGSLRRTYEEISRVKDLGIPADAAAEDIAAAGCSPDVYRSYNSRLRATGNVDFGDLILLPMKILRENLEVRERTRQRFPVILVDEYQDSNTAQFELLRELCGPSTYLCVVGDDDQSIYRFRGAEVANILSFPKVFPGTEIVRLEQNYRSTQSILDVASAVVAHNTGRLGKKLWTEAAAGEPVTIACLGDQEEEAAFCGRLASDGFAGSTAILYRMNAQSRPFEEYFFHLGIPFRLVGTVGFYSREEVRDVVAFLKLLDNPRDEVSFRRIVNKPARGVGAASVLKIIAEWRAGGGSLLEAGARAAVGLAAKARAGLTAFRSLLEELAELVESVPLAELARSVMVRSGLHASYESRDRADDTSKADNLEELVNATLRYGSGREALHQFLLNSALQSAAEHSGGEGGEDGPEAARARVTLITLHNTKGLEFDRVIITGLEEGIFPHESSSLAADDVEEERRLFYVGITRARETLVMTWCRRRRLFGRWSEMAPSRFLDEIPVESSRRIGWPTVEGGVEGFAPGTGVFHEEYGPGIVERSWRSDGNLLVQVRFQSGRVAKFLPKYAGLERIATGD
jgi:DNA helicase-2/ATP-dependent DNA helicase PcrA